jgi:acyl carrier protein
MKEELIHALATALEIEPEKITLNDTFRNYETYSSLTELSVIAMLDSDFGIEIEMNEFNKCKTVEDLVNLVSLK